MFGTYRLACSFCGKKDDDVAKLVPDLYGNFQYGASTRFAALTAARPRSEATPLTGQLGSARDAASDSTAAWSDSVSARRS